MKQQLIKLARVTRLLPALEYLRFLQQVLNAASVNRTVKRDHPDLAFPPLWISYDAYSHCRYDFYLQGGKLMAGFIKCLLIKYLGTNQRLNVLDWGCGPARVIRWMDYNKTGGALYGCDYNATTIRWCQSALTGITFQKNELAPPLPFGANTMDVVYCWSVFTHLSATQMEAWLKEISRVLKPGGLFIFSTQSEEVAHKLLKEETLVFCRDGIVVRDRVVEGSRLFAAFHSREYVRKQSAAYFTRTEDVGLVPDSTWEQCMWVATK